MRFSLWPSNGHTWDETLELAQWAERAGLDGFWYADHLMPNRPDGTPDPAWDPPNFPHAPTAIAVSGDYVYVGGPFFNVGVTAQRGIAKLNREIGRAHV